MLRTLHQIPANGRKLNVVGYARVSTDKYEAEQSLENQIDYYTTLILENPNWEYCGVYADEGITGTSLEKREQFKNMVAKAMKGLIDIVLVKSISRFGRNVIDVIGAINQLRTVGVEVYFEKEGISSLDSSCTIALSLYAQLAESEANSTSKNVLWSIENKMKRGIYRLPVESMLGYDYNEKGELVIIEEEANIVRTVFDMYNQGLSMNFIIKTMEERGYKTALGNDKWNQGSIFGILTNEKYVGDCHLHKTFAPKVSARTMVVNRGEVDDYYVKDGHLPIISRDVWDKACAIRECRREKMGKKKGMKKPDPWPESGFAVCPYCRKNYFIKRLTNATTGIRYSLNCSSNRSTLTCRQSESVFLNDIRDIVLHQLNLIKQNPLMFKKLMKENLLIDIAPLKAKIEFIDRDISDLEDKLNSFKGPKNDSYMALKNEIKKRVENLIAERKVVENTLLTQENNERIIKETMELIDSLPSTEYNPNYRRLFKKAIIKSRTDITFVIGNEDLSNLDLLNVNKLIEEKHTIKVRGQQYTVSFGLFFNK